MKLKNFISIPINGLPYDLVLLEKKPNIEINFIQNINWTHPSL